MVRMEEFETRACRGVERLGGRLGEEVTGEWRELLNEFHVVCWSPSDNRVIGWAFGTYGDEG